MIFTVALVDVQFERFSARANIVGSLKRRTVAYGEAELDFDAFRLLPFQVRRTQPIVHAPFRGDIADVLRAPECRCRRREKQRGKEFRVETQFAPAVVRIAVAGDFVPI